MLTAQAGKKERGRPTRAGWWLIPLYLALAAVTLILFGSYTRAEGERAFLTPIFSDDKGWDIYRLDNSDTPVSMTVQELFDSGGTVYLSRVMDPGYEASGFTILELDGYAWQTSVFLDGELLYTTTPGSGQRKEAVRFPERPVGVPGRNEYVRLTLPSGYGGKVLTLAMAQPSTGGAGLPMVRLSSEAVISAEYVSGANRLGMPAAAYMTVAFLLLGLLFYGVFQGRWDWPMLLLTAAAALQSLYQLRDFDFYMANRFTLDSPATVLIPPLFVTLPLAYLYCRMQKRTTVRLLCLAVPSLVAMIPGVLGLFSLYLPGEGYLFCQQMLYLAIIAALVFIVREARAGNQAFRLFLAGLGALLGALAVACLCSGELSAYVVSIMQQAINKMPDTPLYWCGTALFILSAVLSVEHSIRRATEQQMRSNALSIQVSALQGRIDAARAAEEAIRIERHDLHHKLQAVSQLIARGEQATALQYISASQRELDALKPQRWCQNPVLDAIFSSYFAQAKRQDIQVEASLAIPNELPMDATELSIVFANALENAIHACAALPKDERKIICKCISRPRLMFVISNPYAGTVRFGTDGRPLSAEQGHGIGTRSIAAFCEKHGAYCTYEVKDGWFSIKLALS